LRPTATQLGLLPCTACGLVNRPPPSLDRARCARCGARLFARRPRCLARTWALLITAIVLYVPANMLPIMDTSSLFGAQTDTILSGITFLWRSGSWLLALLVFVASVFVPLAKIIALALLALSLRRRWQWRRHDRTRLYRMLASIHAGPGAIAFGAVVVLTMFAAMAFDPRLIWDQQDEHHG
jgi:paraquat-inducible protein A